MIIYFFALIISGLILGYINISALAKLIKIKFLIPFLVSSYISVFCVGWFTHGFLSEGALAFAIACIAGTLYYLVDDDILNYPQ